MKSYAAQVGVKLNLGCGNDIRPDCINVDFRQTHPSVQVIDLSKFPWPFPDAYADEILMLDFLEHFPYASTPFILLECNRVLRPGGEVVVQVPDAVHLMRAIARSGQYLCNNCGEDMTTKEHCPKCGQWDMDIAEAAMRRLYGGQDHLGNFHHTCFSKEMLIRKAGDAGLSFVADEEYMTQQYPNWNFKLRFRKGDVWGAEIRQRSV